MKLARLRHSMGLAACLGLCVDSQSSDAQSSRDRSPPVSAEMLGAPDARFPEGFSLVRGLRELSDGRVLVSDWIEERVVALDLATGSLTEVGRAGGGPGEFRLPSGLLALPGDSTLLEDVGNGRLAVIGPDLRIYRTFPARQPNAAYGISPRAADANGWLYFIIPRWARGPDAAPGDSVDLARWNPATQDVETVARILGSGSVQGPSMAPRVPFVVFSPQDGWALAPDGRVALVRAADYRVEWRQLDGTLIRGPANAISPIPVTDEDRREFVRRFLIASPTSGRGDGASGLGHTPAEWTKPEAVARMVDASQFAATRPAFEAGGIWATENGELWVKRSLSMEAAATFDVFDGRGVAVKRVTLPVGRAVIGMGRSTLYAVVLDDVDLQIIERYGRP